MKKIAILCISFFACVFPRLLSAQTAERDVLANAGGTATLPNKYTVSWTLGETFVATRKSTNPAIIVTEGFQQAENGTVPTLELPDAVGQITVAPNPAGDALYLSLSVLPGISLHATLLDLNGRALRQAALMDLQTTLDLRGLPAAVYVLSLTDGKNWVRSVQVVKQ